MDGIILVNKPQNFTSFDVVAKMRGILRTKKIGHTGTLDPMATGLLVVLVGNATPLCDRLPDDKKEYVGGFKLGVKTDTEDIWGKVTEEKESHVKEKDILNALPHFTGEILQVPPMYSAIKIGGKKLCDLAREGIEVEREGRPIKIDEIELLSFDEEKQEGLLRIACRKGTYIRTLIKDIGDFLGCGATMTSLKRTVSNGFSIEDSFTFEEIEGFMKDGTVEEHMMPAFDAFREFPDVEVGPWQAKMIENGVKLNRDKLGNLPDGSYRIWHEGKFLGFIEYLPGEPNLRMIFKGK